MNQTAKPKRKAPKTAFKKGQSGNPGGRPKTVGEVRELAMQHTAAALKRIVELMDSTDERVSLDASKHVLDRAIGRPIQQVAGDDNNGPIKLRIIWDDGTGD